MLRDTEEEDNHVKDYLRLGGCTIIEKRLLQVKEFDNLLHGVDVVLVNCMDISCGFSFCKKIRERTQLPIVILTPCAEEWAKIKMFQIGVDDYLVEPYSQGELVARITARVERYRRLARPFGYINVNDLEIDAFRRSVKLKGEEIVLRAKEYEVLLYLAQNANRIMTKEDIFSTVWKEAIGDGYYNCVAVHIKRIREKIEKDIENPRYIETIWGIGYRFCK